MWSLLTYPLGQRRVANLCVLLYSAISIGIIHVRICLMQRFFDGSHDPRSEDRDESEQPSRRAGDMKHSLCLSRIQSPTLVSKRLTEKKDKLVPLSLLAIMHQRIEKKFMFDFHKIEGINTM